MRSFSKVNVRCTHPNTVTVVTFCRERKNVLCAAHRNCADLFLGNFGHKKEKLCGLYLCLITNI